MGQLCQNPFILLGKPIIIAYVLMFAGSFAKRSDLSPKESLFPFFKAHKSVKYEGEMKTVACL